MIVPSGTRLIALHIKIRGCRSVKRQSLRDETAPAGAKDQRREMESQSETTVKSIREDQTTGRIRQRLHRALDKVGRRTLLGWVIPPDMRDAARRTVARGRDTARRWNETALHTRIEYDAMELQTVADDPHRLGIKLADEIGGWLADIRTALDAPEPDRGAIRKLIREGSGLLAVVQSDRLTAAIGDVVSWCDAHLRREKDASVALPSLDFFRTVAQSYETAGSVLAQLDRPGRIASLAEWGEMGGEAKMDEVMDVLGAL